ncbi:hypothetical protein NCU16631 [Neurospora crassa OR74A]|uniref:Autophagy-related protein 1 n=1 Tax=Neurospora crassa (strain ATCC 24698 / 74-OR23-1A / CBS 708.71 / DSM 1257 / FGSC 987) TaxID=367110 RepID=U9W814_NEUCR|nr:hypothetical protein NCU16631 [Neurospora crassa OR74A]ESA43160.1 hypothetical protein NCU16631 [Neurospora crassa OR74A]|eukprot:XP_011394024.1 hypothetical protein NCU16631 [Neurospora crassa OR74A]
MHSGTRSSFNNGSNRSGFASYAYQKPGSQGSQTAGPTWHVKVADFGITRDLSNTVAGTHQIGTFGYMAPELWHTSERYTSAVDVWALGAIAFCMRTGSPPFPNPLTLANYPEDPTVFPTLKLRSSTQPCRGFITGAMAAIPQERLTIIEAVGHYWLSRDMNVSKR